MAAITQSELTAYNPANAASVIPGPTALFTVNVNSINPTQLNEGLTEVDTKANAFDDITTAAALQTALLGDIEPVVIGPNGQLYITDGHHTFTALLDSAWGASNPTVDVNVIANYSGDTFAQFYAALAANDLEYPVNDGVVVTPSAAAFSANGAFGTSLTGLTSDVYRGLEYSILKNKNSKLFTTTSNIASAVGSAIPGLDKTAAFYSDFIYADAYRDANGGKGLPYLSPGDIQLATQWNLNGANVTTLPGLGTVLVAQLPGYILSGSISISGAISNATLANGVLDGSKTGAFTTAASASFNGLRSLNVGPSSIGSGAPGFIMQLGADSGYTVTLTGANTYTGGTTILAGTLIINADAALGAAGTTGVINGNSIVASVEADNGIIFDSLTEGNGTLQITSSFTESRAIVLESETANINLNNFTLTLASPLYSAGALSDGLSNAANETPITVEDTSTGGGGVLVLSATSNNSNFYGNWIITSGTLKVSSDASLGNTTGSPELIGQIDLNGGTLQAGASFTSVRSLFLGGGSTYDTNGFATVWQGNLQDVQRTLTVKNSSTTTAGSVAFGTFEVSATATLNVQGASATATDSVTFTNGIIRDTAATLLLQDTTSGGVLGTTGGFIYDTSTGAGAANTVTNRIVSPWIAVQTATAVYNFATYGAKGFTAATGLATTLIGSTSSTTVSLTGPLNLALASSAYALSLAANATVTTLGFTLTLGDGANPTGLILDGGASLGTATGALAGTLATAGSELVIWAGGTAATANTIDTKITGSAGLDVSGAGTVNINTASTETGAVTIDSGVVGLAVANVFATASSVNLSNVKTSPSPAVLTITASQTFEALNSVGNNSSVNFSSGAAITIGDATNQSSAISATFTEAGAATAGALTKNGTGLVDLSGGKVTLIAGSTILVNAGVLRGGNGIFGTQATAVTIASGAELQYSGNGGSQLSLNVAGAGAFHLISGTVQILGTLATTANTALELGTTLDVTTAAFTGANASITDSGGTVVFDQTTTGSYVGVISDGFEAGGATDPLDLAAASGVAEQGTLIKDDSVSDKLGNVTLTKAQTFTGATYIEAGTLTLGTVNTLATSSGVTLGRVGGGATAVLALAAANQIAGLADTAGNTDSVTLGSFTLTLNSAAQNAFAGIISGAGALVTSGTGTQTLSGANTFAGGLTLKGGTTVLANAAAAGTGTIAFSGAATLQIALGDAPANTITGFTTGDTIDLASVGTETTTIYSAANGTVTVTGGASSVTLKLNAPPANYGYQATADGAGGTDLTLVTLPAAPSVTAVTGTLFSNSDVTVSGTGISGDTVTLYDGTTLVGSGTVTAGAFSILTSQPLPFGPQTLTATQTIPAGPASNASAGFGVEINQAITGASGPVTLTTPQTYVTLGATVTNAAGAALTGTGATPFILLNKGSVTASGNGVYLQTGSLTNATTGIITNTAYTAGPGVKAAGVALGAAASLPTPAASAAPITASWPPAATPSPTPARSPPPRAPASTWKAPAASATPQAA